MRKLSVGKSIILLKVSWSQRWLLLVIIKSWIHAIIDPSIFISCRCRRSYTNSLNVFDSFLNLNLYSIICSSYIRYAYLPWFFWHFINNLSNYSFKSYKRIVNPRIMSKLFWIEFLFQYKGDQWIQFIHSFLHRYHI